MLHKCGMILIVLWKWNGHLARSLYFTVPDIFTSWQDTHPTYIPIRPSAMPIKKARQKVGGMLKG
ncbi:MAG: hypothetical protein F6K24_11655 [Okeania sp. SIO2D1]|nr:hypothetical protein [Okeania sp. SIO2D1]